jgi:hypothetical protein
MWISKIRSLGDHRSCNIEIHWKALVGEDMIKIARPEAQRLSSTTYHSTVEYVRKLSVYASQHKLMLKSHNLYKDTNGPLTQEQQAQFKSIDHMKTEGMIHAEKKCRSLCMGEVDFSPDVNIAKGQHYVWQMIVCKWRGKHMSLKKICCVAKAVGIMGNPLQINVTLRDAKRSFKAADEE